MFYNYSMKVFFLGATGLIGNHTVRELLNNGYEVRALIRRKSRIDLLQDLNLEFFEGDIRDRETLIEGMKGCDIAVHSAGYYPRYSIKEDVEIEKALKEIGNVMDSCLISGIKKILYVSSIGTIWKDRNGIGREDIPFDYRKVKGLYHRIKFLMEEEVKKYSEKGLEVFIVNPTLCVGEFETKPIQFCLIPRVIKVLPFYTDGKMNAVDVKDVARGIILVLEKGKALERYILGGENLTIKEFLIKIAKIAKAPPPLIKIPLLLAFSGAYLSEYLSYYILKKNPSIPLSGIQMAKYSFFVTTEKAERELGYKPSPIENAIERAIEWFKKIGYI
jgi:dihydroflavonol-4-reductase